MQLSGPANSLEEFVAYTESAGVSVSIDALAEWTALHSDAGDAPTWEVPMLKSEAEKERLSKLRAGIRFDAWAETHSGVFPVREFDETNQRSYFQEASGVPIWKGRSFDQYDPHGTGTSRAR